MPTAPEIADLSPEVLARHYDPGAVRRGTAYDAGARATILGQTRGSLTGVVRGSAPSAYLVEVEYWSDARGLWVTDTCSCPLGGCCKHAVALILTARRVAPEARRSDWRQTLDEIVDDRPGGTDDNMPLALEIDLTRPKSSRYAPDPAPQVTIRPLRMGRKGNWVKTGATWRDISSPYGWDLRDSSATQRSLLSSILAGARNVGYSAPTGPLPLSGFGPGLWPLLRQASDAGIEFVRERAGHRVVLSDHDARVAIDLSARDDGDVAVSFGFRHDGALVAPRANGVGLLGDPAHGVFHVQGDVLELIPLDRPIPTGLARRLTPEPVVVPAGEVADLLDHYEPLLATLGEVGSSDGSVTITRSEFEGLVALVEHHRLDAARLRWAVRYRRGDQVTDRPLAASSGAGRDRSAERAAADSLDLPVDLLAALTDEHGRPTDVAVEGHDAVALLSEVVPWLEDRGQVVIDLTGDAPPLREATTDPLIELSVTTPEGDEGGRTDWFDLDVQVSIEDESIEFAELFAALTRDEPVLVLSSGTWLRLDRPEFAALRDLITEARGLAEHDATDAAAVRINRFQSSWWDDLTALGVVAHQSEQWERSIAGLRELEAPTAVEPPAGLTASLRPYQQDGLDWLAFLHRHGLGGILADDMGLGKTVQTLALFLHVLDSQPDARFLVVAPTSVVENWRREVEQFAPGVAVRTVSETAARSGCELADVVGDARVVVTSYALFRIDAEQYQGLGWEMLVLDEAQFVKNHRSKTYQCVRRLDAPTKLAITGTPLENSLMDLWSLLSITAPGLYPDPTRFSEVYRRPIESGRAPELLSTLRRRIAPLMRRRTKGEVLTDLPPKTELTVEVELGARHARIYQTQLQRQRQRILGLVGDVDKHRFEILKSLTMLRQLSLDPGLVDPEHDNVGSAKLDRLVEDLEQVVAEGHRALVFSQFTRYLTRVRTRLDAAGIDHSYLDGRTRNRDAAIESFTNGTNPVFVISLKAGGFGLNLTQADYCFVLDPWWNPAVETQAVDRTHRIGQRNAVMVYRYVSSATIEEKVMELKERKAALFASVLDADGALSGALDAQDIRALFEL